MPFENNIFINCPFDKAYVPLLRAMVFTTIYLDLNPNLSQTISSANIRINQIKQLIRTSKYGIHDLSRSKPLEPGELPRFNMPYELGLDIGAMEYGGRQLRSKKILILDTERYHYQKVLSDIGGQDISNHDDRPELLVKRIRDWLSGNNPHPLASPSEIWTAFNQFTDDLFEKLTGRFTPGEIEEMPIADYLKFARDWIVPFKAKNKKS